MITSEPLLTEPSVGGPATIAGRNTAQPMIRDRLVEVQSSRLGPNSCRLRRPRGPTGDRDRGCPDKKTPGKRDPPAFGLDVAGTDRSLRTRDVARQLSKQARNRPQGRNALVSTPPQSCPGLAEAFVYVRTLPFRRSVTMIVYWTSVSGE